MLCSGKSGALSPAPRTAWLPPMTCCCRSTRRSASTVLPSPSRSRMCICVPLTQRSSSSPWAMATPPWPPTPTSPRHDPSPPYSCLRCLRTASLCFLSAPLCFLFNVSGKLWILREHMVERVFVERVEVTVVHGADTGITGLYEEQGDFPEELALREGVQHGFTVSSNDFHRTATDEVHVPAVLPNQNDKI